MGGLEEIFIQAGANEVPIDEVPPAAPADNTPVVPDSAADGGAQDPVVSDVDPVVPPVVDPAVPAVPETPDEVRQLRQMLRDSNRQIAQMQAAIAKSAIKPQIDDEGNEVPVPATRVELISNAIKNIGETKGAVLELMVDTMELNPKFADIRDVCSKSNFDDIFESAAQQLSSQQNRPYNEVLLEVELSVWQKKNPYQYMYDVIKTYHPKYAVKAPVTPAAASPGAVTPAKTVSPAAPSSIAGMGGGDGDNSGGWTSAKIDAMDLFSDRDKIPDSVYDRYLAGTLK